MDAFVDALHGGSALEPRLRLLYDTRYCPSLTSRSFSSPEVAGRVQRLLDRGVIRIAMVAEIEDFSPDGEDLRRSRPLARNRYRGLHANPYCRVLAA